MKLGSSLVVIAVGAILAFAVTATPSFFNLHTAGWVLMLIGVIGLLLPRWAGGWLGRRVLVRRTYPSGRVERVPVSSYVDGDSGAAPAPRGLPARPTLLDQDDDLIEDAAPGAPARTTEVIEDIYEQP